MMLFLFRHGKASRQDADGPRSLTSKGREEVAKVAEYFKKRGIKVHTLWHSPKTRAVQTAEVFLHVVGKRGVAVEEKKALQPEGDCREIYDEVNVHEGKSLMLVTHLPFVEELASLFACDSPHAEISFPTAGLAAFEGEKGSWKWLWSLDPQSVSKL